MLTASEIVALHDRLTLAWHQGAEDGAEAATQYGNVVTETSRNSLAEAATDWLGLVARQHGANFDLWHIEDEARAPGATEAQLADIKRRVDLTNQRRNDLAEELDRALLDWLEARGAVNPEAPLHSESPGLMIDRLSILALKIYHTREEAERAGAPAGHDERNRQRLGILEEQRADLAGCLNQLWRETLAGTRRFKLYRQLKMYNDPSLNPAIYRKSGNEPSKPGPPAGHPLT
jgi:hypothetical protein